MYTCTAGTALYNSLHEDYVSLSLHSKMKDWCHFQSNFRGLVYLFNSKYYYGQD